MLIANGQLTLPPCKRPAEIDKVDDSKPVSEVVGHTLRQSFVFKELVQEGLRTKALTLGEEEKSTRAIGRSESLGSAIS